MPYSSRSPGPEPAPEQVSVPYGVRARAGRGQITVDWDPVPGAAGYLMYRADGDGAARVIDHRGGDLLAVPGPPYADTNIESRSGLRTARLRLSGGAAGCGPRRRQAHGGKP